MSEAKRMPKEAVEAMLQARKDDPTIGTGTNPWIIPPDIAAKMFGSKNGN